MEMDMDMRRISLIAFLFAAAASIPAFAQQAHVADQATLDHAVADHLRQGADDRQEVLRVLENDQVRELAEGIGLDVTRAKAAVATLDETELGAIAAQARVVNDALAGGQGSVTISTTFIIIALLVLILLIVAI
jgi:hypothetical protein